MRPTMTLRRSGNRLPINHRPPLWWRMRHASTGAGSTGPDVRDDRLARLEAVLASADDPVTPRRLSILAELSGSEEVRQLVDRLRTMYADEDSAIQVVEIAGGYQLMTRPEFHPWLAKLRQASGESKLSPALLETLAIVAYRQPIMRADLEAIRGVHCGEGLRQLMERGLVRIAGRHDSLGRPVLYATTKKFLQHFGLRDLRDLPPVTD